MEEVLQNHDELEQWFINVKSCGYMITIKDIGPASQVLNNVHKQTGFPSMEAKDSNNDMVGFEDIDDHLEEDDDVAKSDTGKKANLDVEVKDSAVQESSNFQNNSNSAQEVERSMDNLSPAGSNNSVTRTKTVCFSYDGCFEKIFKITWQLQELENDHGNIDHHPLDAESSHPPPGFERCINYGLDHSKTLEDGRDLLGHQTQKDFQGNEELSKAPWFDSHIQLNNPTQEALAPKKVGRKEAKSKVIASKNQLSMRNQVSQASNHISAAIHQLQRIFANWEPFGT
ncbi:hypothetical protein Cgig2_019904 [Carnegiea gigantea]|uniref:Uncharacterized protein n=1 Tax=Carnegiea gigantea TaxID=171969 RepID=A0A9Q1QJY9_9CARY|nr:hypothetical protein Cgig2_019904 [Carnegiea gigantea]